MLSSCDTIHRNQNISNLHVIAEDPNVYLMTSETHFQ